jgi:signal transduction histidine kinase/ActR/RegA family two-component response regulator
MRRVKIFIWFLFIVPHLTAGPAGTFYFDDYINDNSYNPGKIIIGDDINFPPYSYIDENGEPAGFTIEIARATARAMGLEVEIRLDSWDIIRKALEKGEIDAISGMFYSRDRERLYRFTSRHSISTGDIFTRKNRQLTSLQELEGKKVVVQKGDIIGEYLKSLNSKIIIVEVSTVTEALKLINSGLFDYAGIMKLPGLYAITKNDLKDVKPQGIQFLPMDYSMAVRKDDEDLLYILNAGLHVLKATEEYQSIHDRWLGVYEEQFQPNLFYEYRWIFLTALTLIIILIIISVILKYLVNKKTTELQILNNNLMSSNNEILQKNELLAKSQAELKERLELIEKQGEIIRFKQNFLANMSHEIRTPLTGILGIIEILGKSELTPHQQDYIHILRQSGENLTEIINQVLDYSKIEAGKVEINKKSFVFNDLIVQAVNTFQSLGGENLKFGYSVDERMPFLIKADWNRLLQIINNFISNSIKFTPSGKIHLHAELSDHFNGTETAFKIKISVTDTGIGISPEKQKVLFKPFAQIHESDHREYEGTGLGLSICKELADLHGGEVGVISEELQGSTFWFTFIADRSDNQLNLLNIPEIQPEAPIPSLRILLAEDKVINQKVIGLLLSSLGHTVEIASNGEMAVEKYQPHQFDLILMDIQMPVMDGITATGILKQKFPELPPVVGLSANAFEGDREKYIRMGLDDYMTKPFKQDDFVMVVERVLKNRKFRISAG